MESSGNSWPAERSVKCCEGKGLGRAVRIVPGSVLHTVAEGPQHVHSCFCVWLSAFENERDEAYPLYGALHL